MFGAKFSEDGELYRAAVVDKEAEDKVKVRFIDFGNTESKNPLTDLFVIPKDIATEPSSSVCVAIDTGLEDTEENQEHVGSLLDEENLTVIVCNGLGQFSLNSKKVVFKAGNKKVVEKPEPKVISQEPPKNFKETKPIVQCATNANPEKLEKPFVAKNSSPIQVNHQKTKESTISQPVAAASSTKNTEDTLSTTDDLRKSKEHSDVSPKSATATKDSLSFKSRTLSAGRSCEVNSVVPEPSSPSPTPVLSHDSAPSKKISKSKIFSTAISEIKSQLIPQNNDRNPSKYLQKKLEGCPWSIGDLVVIKSRTGLWQNATVVDTRTEEVMVSSPREKPIWISIKDVRSPCIPAEALNAIDKDLNANDVVQGRPRDQGDGETADRKDCPTAPPSIVGKVKDWMDKNLNSQPVVASPPKLKPAQLGKLPVGPRLIEYCKTNPGSLHVQSVLTTSNMELARYLILQ